MTQRKAKQNKLHSNTNSKGKDTTIMPDTDTMADIVVDLTDVPVGFEPLPAGLYKGIFTGSKNAKTKNNDPMLKLEFTVDEDSTGDTKFAGRKLWVNQTIIATGEKSNLHYLKAALVNMGASAEDVSGRVPMGELLKELRGREEGVALRVEVGEYNGNATNNVNIVASPDSWS